MGFGNVMLRDCSVPFELHTWLVVMQHNKGPVTAAYVFFIASASAATLGDQFSLILSSYYKTGVTLNQRIDWYKFI